MSEIPETMRALVAPKACKPAEYELRDIPTPSIAGPTEVLLRVHAAGMNTGELQMAAGHLGMFNKPK